MQQPSSTSSSALNLTPDQIRRRLRDYDAQVRQAVEEGTIRQLMKMIYSDLVSRERFF